MQITGYRVEYRLAGGAGRRGPDPGTNTEVTIQDLFNGYRYEVRVAA